jgi:formylglycine-generating enzyme required for sulfatase activity
MRPASFVVIAALAAGATGTAAQHARTFQSAEGHSMVLVDGPISVAMGSPLGERGRVPASDSAAEPQHTVRIPRSFAIAATEVTVAQFRRFLDANPDAKSRFRFEDAPDRMAEIYSRLSPDDDGPAIAMTWYEAAMYCNWLSARDGLPPADWVYPIGILRDGVEMPANYLQRRGYRLPTEPEWEYAARAGTTTARFFGDSDERLGDYASYARRPQRSKDDPVDPNDPQRTQRVGLLKPNPLGLFDIYGNVWEWTQDRVERFQTADVVDDHEDPVLRVSDRDARTRRGGSFSYGAAFSRSALRGPVTSFPGTRRDTVGFRVARTVR